MAERKAAKRPRSEPKASGGGPPQGKAAKRPRSEPEASGGGPPLGLAAPQGREAGAQRAGGERSAGARSGRPRSEPKASGGGPPPSVPAGTWVELHRILLAPGERAPQVPPETQAVPLELAVRGWLVTGAAVGEEAEIATPAGRRVRGTLRAVLPGHAHGFGPPEPALLEVGRELRALLRERRQP
jgi:hypothetical protein